MCVMFRFDKSEAQGNNIINMLHIVTCQINSQALIGAYMRRAMAQMLEEGTVDNI